MQRGGVNDIDGHSGFLQLGDQRALMLRRAIGDGEVSAGDRAGHQERAGFDAVRDNGVIGAVEFRDTLDFQHAGIVAGDLRAHFTQHRDQVGHFGFARGVFEDGFAVGEGRGHQNIFRPGDGDFIEDDVRAFKAAVIWDFGLDIAVLGGNLGAHFFQRGEVQVHGARTDGTAAGQRDARHPHPRDKRSKREDRSAHGFYEFVGSDFIVDRFSL